MSVRVLTIDLAEPPADHAGCAACTALLILVCVNGRPLGWVRVEHDRRDTVSGAALRAAVTAAIDWELLPHALLPGYAIPPGTLPPISVVVRNAGDPAALAACLHAVTACAYPTYELIVVDPAPSAALERLVAGFPAARYLRAAHWNEAVAAAQYDLIAFVAAECRPAPTWLHAVAAGFGVADVAAVSGPVAPLALATPAQRVYEEVCGGLGRGTYSRTMDAANAHRYERIAAIGLGSGKNLALRQSALAALGGFHPALDAGADQELLVRLLAGGMRVRYSGEALVWHAHPADWRALGRTLFARGFGQGAALIATARSGSVERSDLLHYAVFVWLRAILGRLRKPEGLPRRLALLELIGAVRGLLSLTAPPGDATL